MNWFQAFTLLKSNGHSHDDVLDMSPSEFRGYLRASVWLRNKDLAEKLHLDTLAASAGFSGNEELFTQINDTSRQLLKAHEHV